MLHGGNFHMFVTEQILEEIEKLQSEGENGFQSNLLFILDITTMCWIPNIIRGSPFRGFHTAVTDDNSNSLLLYGGSERQTRTSSLFRFQYNFTPPSLQGIFFFFFF